jgi:hypothetical protein
MGTAHSALKQVAVGFTKWTEYVAFVSHFFTPSTKICELILVRLEVAAY